MCIQEREIHSGSFTHISDKPGTKTSDTRATKFSDTGIDNACRSMLQQFRREPL